MRMELRRVIEKRNMVDQTGAESDADEGTKERQSIDGIRMETRLGKSDRYQNETRRGS